MAFLVLAQFQQHDPGNDIDLNHCTFRLQNQGQINQKGGETDTRLCMDLYMHCWSNICDCTEG